MGKITKEGPPLETPSVTAGWSPIYILISGAVPEARPADICRSWQSPDERPVRSDFDRPIPVIRTATGPTDECRVHDR